MNRQEDGLQCHLHVSTCLYLSLGKRETACVSFSSAAAKTGIRVGQPLVPRFTTQQALAPGCATRVCVACIHPWPLLRVCLSQACSRATCPQELAEAIPAHRVHSRMEAIPAHRVSTRARMSRADVPGYSPEPKKMPKRKIADQPEKEWASSSSRGPARRRKKTN